MVQGGSAEESSVCGRGEEEVTAKCHTDVLKWDDKVMTVVFNTVDAGI